MLRDSFKTIYLCTFRNNCHEIEIQQHKYKMNAKKGSRLVMATSHCLLAFVCLQLDGILTFFLYFLFFNTVLPLRMNLFGTANTTMAIIVEGPTCNIRIRIQPIQSNPLQVFLRVFQPRRILWTHVLTDDTYRNAKTQIAQHSISQFIWQWILLGKEKATFGHEKSPLTVQTNVCKESISRV